MTLPSTSMMGGVGIVLQMAMAGAISALGRGVLLRAATVWSDIQSLMVWYLRYPLSYDAIVKGSDARSCSIRDSIVLQV